MAKILPFETHTKEYDEWFGENHWVYKAELKAVENLLIKGNGIEIGVGTGRFAEPLGIKKGVEPSIQMREIAEKRGIDVLDGVAEDLPLADSKYDFALMVTTICFVDNVKKAIQEAYRILSKDGFLIIGLVDRNSPIGQIYLKYQQESVFYREATFYTVDEVTKIMEQSGFDQFSYQQTIFGNLSEIKEDEPVKSGYGEGSFVVIRGKK